MNPLVKQTKITIPERRPDLLSRKRLLDMVYELLDYKLIIVASPAGYGKTSLLVDFAHRTDIPICWYSLDTLDRDAQTFLSHFIASIQRRFPTFGTRSMAILESFHQANLDLDRLAITIANEVYDHIHEHYVIILDDYHLVTDNKDIDYFVNRFVQEVDENCHLILSSRTLMTLPDMTLLIARSQVGGLSYEELAFRPVEIQSLALQNYHQTISEQTAEELAQEAEGWITGLLLSTQTKWQGMVDRLRVARVSGVGLYDYLAQQVLDQQSPPIREFLLRTSLIEEFDSELCEGVLGDDINAQVMIEAVLQSNLFVLPVGVAGKWIRYHHLFRDFLQSQLEREHPEEKESILKRLAIVYAERGDWEKSYAIYQRLGDLESEADLVNRAGPFLLKSGRISTLVDWIDELPGDVVNTKPGLLSLRGGAAIMRGQVEQAITYLNQAELMQRGSQDIPGLAISLLRKATANRFLGKYSISLENASEALGLIGDSTNMLNVRAEALRAIGMSFYHVGELDEGIDRLKQSLGIYTALNDKQDIALVLMELGLVSRVSGRYRQALSYYQRALEVWRETNNFMGQANLLNNLGVLYHLMGNYDQAALLYEEALEYAKQSGYTRMEAYLLCGIGDIYTDLDAGESALDAYRQARELGLDCNDRFLLFYIDLAEAIQARRMGELARARQSLEIAQRYAIESSSQYEWRLWGLEAGRLNLAVGNISQAIDHLRLAARGFEEGGQRVEAARTYLYLADAVSRMDDRESCANALDRSFSIAGNIDSPHILVSVGMETKNLLEGYKNHPVYGSQVSSLIRHVIHLEENIPTIRRKLRPHTTVVQFAPPKLTVRSFGRSIVELDGKPVTAVEWQNQKRAREIFFYLLAHPEGLTKEEIGLVFWPESSAAQLKLQFKNTIYRIRHALGQDVIAFDDDRYYFNRNLDYDYDVESLLTKIAEGYSASSPGEKIAAYQIAMEIYKGDYLVDFEQTWVAEERERLWRIFADVLLAMAEMNLEANEYRLSLEYCQRVLSRDHCLEEAHRIAMRAYAARGDRADVIRQFERCRRALLEEVSSKPSPQTELLFQTLIA